MLSSSAQGFGLALLPAPNGEPVRAVPLLARRWPNTPLAGFAAETVRVAAGGTTLIATTPPQLLRIGEYVVPLSPDGLLRLHFSPGSHRRERTIPAVSLLKSSDISAKLTGKIVFLGASAPEAGSLWRTVVGGFTPSVQIQAEAAEQILTYGTCPSACALDAVD
jgi:adenylate cyclase